METYRLYVDVKEDRRTRPFLSTVRMLQEGLVEVYPKALDDLSNLLDKDIREFIRERDAFPGIMVSFNQFGFDSRGTVETEIMAGRGKRLPTL